jgi:hypothetical protein
LPWEAFLREAVRAEFQVDFYHPTGGHPWKIVAPSCRATRHCPDTPARAMPATRLLAAVASASSRSGDASWQVCVLASEHPVR